jgi:hypothetical protein
MATLQVMPRPTPAEHSDTGVEVDVDEELSERAQLIEDWAAKLPAWEFTLHEGHDFDRPNNVEGRLLFVDGGQTSSMRFRLDQLDRLEVTAQYLVLIFEEKDGIAKLARCTANGLDIELFHILTFT